MINIEDYSIFLSNKSSLKETSKDNHDGKEIYMTESEIDVVDYDKVKDKYVESLTLSEVPCSNDALYIGESGELYFIEFKNGCIDKKVVFDIRLKIFDSLLMFMDICKLTADFTRDNLEYILVYNETKNTCDDDESTNMQASRSRLTIGRHFYERKAKKRFVRFNLERFEKLYLKKIYTYTEQEFNDNFILKYSR